MANYSIVANSTFQPFTYQELVAPIAHQQQVMDKIADEYDKLSSQADVLEAMGANDKDKGSKVYQQYKNYSDRLRAEADNLYRNGLNTESRMRLSELRRMYNTDIVPIQNAWQKREKEAELQLKAQLDASSKGIDLYFSRNAADTPLQSYLDNPNQTFRTINGQALMNEVAAQFKAMANQVQVDKNGNPWIGKQQLSPIEYSIITQKGMDYNQYMDFINNPNDPRFANIRGIINGTLTAHGAQDFDATTQQRLFGLASQGVAAGVGERGMQFHTDELAKMQETYNQQLDLARKKGEIPDRTSAGIDYFNRQAGTLPIAIADKNINEAVTNNAKNFGWRSANNEKGYEPYRMHIAYDYMVDGGRFAPPGKVAHAVDVDLFKSDGKVKTWNEFSTDVRNATKNQSKVAQEAALKKAREQFNMAKSTATSLGLNPNRGYTRQEVTDALEVQRNTGAAGYINGYNWNHKNSDWNPTMQKLSVREIKKMDHDGKFTLDSKMRPFADLIGDEDINKNKQDVHAFISNQNGQEGVIFTVGNRQFYLSKDAMASANSNASQAFYLLKAAENNVKKAKQFEKTNPQESYTLQREADNWTNSALSLLSIGLVADDNNPTNNTVVSPTPTQNGAL